MALEIVDAIFHTAVAPWKQYGNNCIKTGKNTLTIALETLELSPEAQDLVRQSIEAVKYSSVVNVATGADSTFHSLLATLANLQSGDREGLAFAFIGLMLDSVDLFDTATSALKLFVEVEASSPYAPLFAYGLPIGIALATAGSLVKGVQTLQARSFLSEFSLLGKDPEALKAFLTEKLGVTPEEIAELEKRCTLPESERTAWLEKEVANLKELKAAAIKRRSNDSVCKALDRLLALGESKVPLSEEDAKEVIRVMQQIETALSRSLSVKEIALFSGALTVAGLLLIAAPVSIVIPMTLMSLSLVIKIALQIYQDLYMKEGLDLEFHGHVKRMKNLFEKKIP